MQMQGWINYKTDFEERGTTKPKVKAIKIMFDPQASKLPRYQVPQSIPEPMFQVLDT